LDYFGIKDTTAEKQVPLAMASIRDGHMRDWINSDRERLKSLSFADFINEIRDRYLDSDWEDKIRREKSVNPLCTKRKITRNGTGRERVMRERVPRYDDEKKEKKKK
jgi:hypothetical protein